MSLAFKALSDIPLLLTFLIPGVIFQWGRSWWHPGVAPKVDRDSVGGVIVIAVVYAVIVSTLTGTDGEFLRTQNDAWARIELVSYVILTPAILGAMFGKSEREETVSKAARRWGITLASPLKTGWDAAASGIGEGAFVIATLEGGHRVCGLIGPDALFAATGQMGTPDIFIDDACAVSVEGKFSRLKMKRGIWVNGTKIVTLEITKPSKE